MRASVRSRCGATSRIPSAKRRALAVLILEVARRPSMPWSSCGRCAAPPSSDHRQRSPRRSSWNLGAPRAGPAYPRESRCALAAPTGGTRRRAALLPGRRSGGVDYAAGRRRLHQLGAAAAPRPCSLPLLAARLPEHGSRRVSTRKSPRPNLTRPQKMWVVARGASISSGPSCTCWPERQPTGRLRRRLQEHLGQIRR